MQGFDVCVGDALNRSLNMLILQYNEEYQVKSLQFNKLGSVVSPCTVSYICSGLAFIGSTVGDNQFIQIHSDKDWKAKQRAEEEEEEEEDEDDDIAMNDGDNEEDEDGFIEVLEEFINLGPIVDLVAVDLERQGQCQLVCVLYNVPH